MTFSCRAAKSEWGRTRRMQEAEATTRRADAPLHATALARGLLIAAAAAGVFAAIVFYSFPELDIDTSQLFYASGRYNFIGVNALAVDALRLMFFIVFVVICLFVCAGCVIAMFSGRPWLGLPKSKWLLCALCLVTGPGLVSNFGLKNTWGRARPTQIVEFSGTKAYTLPLTPSDQCARNCSFVSGEASNLFMGFFALAFLFLSHARLFLAAGIVMGSLAGLVRMSQGAHFLSDVMFAGVIMAITVALVQLLYALYEVGAKSKSSGPARKSMA